MRETWGQLALIFGVTFILWASVCIYKTNNPSKKIFITRIVVNKTTETLSGSTFGGGRINYIIAYQDGYSDRVDFGEYSITDINDTVVFENYEGASHIFDKRLYLHPQ